jgi:hypothetical protein
MWLMPVTCFARHVTNSPSDVQYIQNKGQWGNNINFSAQLPEGKVFWEKDRITYSLYNLYDFRNLAATLHSPALKEGPRHLPDAKLGMHAFQVLFAGCNTAAKVLLKEQLPFYHNYYLGKDPKRWSNNVPVANAFTYVNYYDHIDMTVYSEQQHPKYDFIIHPGGAVNDIQMQIKGANRIYLKEEQLHILTSVNELIEDKPFAYQLLGDTKQEVPCSFISGMASFLSGSKAITIIAKICTSTLHYFFPLSPAVPA